MLNRILKGIVILTIIPVFLPITTSAQIIKSSDFINELEVSVSPDYPRPNEKAYITLYMYTRDLNSADITWYQDGKIVLEGKGETSYSFKTASAGTKTNIKVDVKFLNGVLFTKSLSINPASVDLVWEANSYTPPFYKGKALHPRQGNLKVVAMPEFVVNDKTIPPEKLIYNWSNETKGYQNQSGYGKNSLIVEGSILGQSNTVKVLVTDPVTNLTAQNSIKITPTDPQIVFYKNDPYYGYIFDSALINSFNLTSEEVQILAVPYYFTKEKDSDLKYNWKLNNQTISAFNRFKNSYLQNQNHKKVGLPFLWKSQI